MKNRIFFSDGLVQLAKIGEIMEYLWYTIASIGAGVGTGLAGLSAATVMVPILIVLCPSFFGEGGVYHATAIALASDIIASAVTTSIYIRHKNIDLKRGWIMLLCIISMCILGSFAAWKAGNVVLGSFTLFLTFFIGIRFLANPDSKRKEEGGEEKSLGLKGVAISVFFGLTIGFGTGFVGTGGGMMMLVVFTAMLSMEYKKAVGTSTFIMTFTALIASVSHIAIAPEILTERWQTLLYCASLATISSIVSAQFANKVKTRVVGLVTGSILTVLGLFLIILNYWEYLSEYERFVAVVKVLLSYLKYLLICLIVLIPIKILTKIDKELWRKLLHFVAYTSSLVMLYYSPSWIEASICCILFSLMVFPILHLMEKHVPAYGNIFNERKKGEVKNSLFQLFITHAVIITIFEGIFDKEYIIYASILSWGIGDTAAALVGKSFGRHKINIPFADRKKSWEGSCAMAIAAFASALSCLLIFSDINAIRCIIFSIIVGILASYSELITKNGRDTVTVPFTVAIALLLLSFI